MIDKINIGDSFIDQSTNKVEKVQDKTITSLLLTQTKVSDKGINCSQWFVFDKSFEKRFKFVKNGNSTGLD